MELFAALFKIQSSNLIIFFEFNDDIHTNQAKIKWFLPVPFSLSAFFWLWLSHVHLVSSPSLLFPSPTRHKLPLLHLKEWTLEAPPCNWSSTLEPFLRWLGAAIFSRALFRFIIWSIPTGLDLPHDWIPSGTPGSWPKQHGILHHNYQTTIA